MIDIILAVGVLGAMILAVGVDVVVLIGWLRKKVRRAGGVR
jgi:hypothetical protein